MSARRKRVISTKEIQFNHKPAKMSLTEKRRESAKPLYLSMIGISSYCVIDRPVFERCRTLLHSELTPWWSFLLADGAHHKKPHSPTHPICIGKLVATEEIRKNNNKCIMRSIYFCINSTCNIYTNNATANIWQISAMTIQIWQKKFSHDHVLQHSWTMSCYNKFGKSAENLYEVIMLPSSTGTNYVLDEHDLRQYGPYAIPW